MMKTTKSFPVSSWRSGEGELILYGASVYGEYALRALETLRIKVDFFCDRSKCNTEFCGIGVISPEELKTRKNAHVIICAAAHFREMELFLKKIGNVEYYDMIPLFDVVAPKNIKTYRAMTYYSDTFLKDQYIMEINGNEKGKDEILITTVNLHVTERCTLNCKDCAEMMPYYRSPRDLDMDKLVSALDKYLSCVDRQPIVAIQGGETFMHRQLHTLVDFCCANRKIEQVSLTTNATIVPQGLNFECLRHPKVAIRINEYGKLSKKIDELKEKLDCEGIKYSVDYLKDYNWFDLGGFDKRNYDKEQVKEVFKVCIFKNDIGIMNGRLYRCARSRAGINLKAIPDCQWEYVDLCADISVAETKERIKKMLKMPYLNSCYYCNSSIYDNIEIERGVQAKGVLPYSLVTEVIGDEIC